MIIYMNTHVKESSDDNNGWIDESRVSNSLKYEIFRDFKGVTDYLVCNAKGDDYKSYCKLNEILETGNMNKLFDFLDDYNGSELQEILSKYLTYETVDIMKNVFYDPEYLYKDGSKSHIIPYLKDQIRSKNDIYKNYKKISLKK